MDKAKAENLKEDILKSEKLPEWLKSLAICVIDKYREHICNYTWTSGCCTEVYPIEFWGDYMEVQLNDNDKRHYKSIDKIAEKFPQIKRAIYYRKDGSCPDTLVFYYKESLS